MKDRRVAVVPWPVERRVGGVRRRLTRRAGVERRLSHQLGQIAGGIGQIANLLSPTGRRVRVPVPPDRQGAESLIEILRSAPGKVRDRALPEFNAWIARAGAPHTIEIVAGNGQSESRGKPVPIAPAVLVKDVNGRPVPRVPVTFAIMKGNGSVAYGGVIADVVDVPTNGIAVPANIGRATLGAWTLGPKAGENLLVASINGISATFKATGKE